MDGTDLVAPPPIPPSYLALHKLKEWDECNTSVPNDPQRTRLARNQLTNVLRSLRYSNPKFHHDPNYDRALHNESAARVSRFLTAHNTYGNEWREMGLGRLPKRGKGKEPDKDPKPSVNGTSTSVIPESQVRPKWSNLGFMNIRRLAAQTTVSILTELDLPCAIFGSMACKLYGNQRLPNDVDILVLPPPERSSITQEEIKALIVQHASQNYHFVLKPSRDPQATYKVLHFVAKPRPSSTSTIAHNLASMALHDTANDNDNDDDDTTPQEFTSNRISVPRRTSSKVDILLPGVMHLPALPTSSIIQRSSLPLVPFPVLFLQKLQGWSDHYAATEARYRAKIKVDVGDLEWCLNRGTVTRYLIPYVAKKNTATQGERFREVWSDRSMFSEEFEELSKARVREFCKIYEGLREAWRAIGFEV